MKIKEVSSITGLTQKTIRFYEEAGLIAPATETCNGRVFRTYSEGDVADLNEIAVLRKARFSIEEIRQMQEGSEELGKTFSVYYQRMQQEKLELEKLVAVLDSVSNHNFTSKSELVQEIKGATAELSLPRADVHPSFRYIDIMEEKLNRKGRGRKKKKAKKQDLALNCGASAMMYHTKPGVRDGSSSGTSVLLTMRMLDDDENV